MSKDENSGEINTDGGAYIEGSVNAEGGDFVGRDNHVFLGRDLPTQQIININGNIRVYAELAILGAVFQRLV